MDESDGRIFEGSVKRRSKRAKSKTRRKDEIHPMKTFDISSDMLSNVKFNIDTVNSHYFNPFLLFFLNFHFITVFS